MVQSVFVPRWLSCALLALAVTGCTRNCYIRKADQQAYGILGEKTSARPWTLPWGFGIEPHPQSRLFDPTPIADPLLPTAAPHLYAYELPSLPPRDPARFDRSIDGPASPAAASAADEQWASVDSEEPSEVVVQPVVYEATEPDAVADDDRSRTANSASQPDAGVTGEPATDSQDAAQLEAETFDLTAGGLPVVPIPNGVWDSLPPNCLRRMFEFQSIRDEYDRTFGREPTAEQQDDSPRLTLEDIVELALINSREYQTQKENLYEAALALSLERYAFDMKFARSGSGTIVDYQHNRSGGLTVNDLAVGTAAVGGRVLATGGDLLARFANDVVLTFNGPAGFTADIGSELFLELSQSVFQRDIRFESLTQAERNVVYAARDFARFRKQFFRDLADDYYGLILSYREIEIATQDYFSNLRAFNQGEAEYRAGRQSRIQVDQFEQTALRSRSVLISRCNTLEEGLDRLKLIVGLPTELPINLDLTELERLTLRDSATVAGERVRRARRNLLSQRRQATTPDQLDVFLNGAMDLARRMLYWTQLREQLGQGHSGSDDLKLLLSRMSVDEARSLMRLSRAVMLKDRAATPPKPPVQIFRRTMELVDLLAMLVDRQRTLAAETSADAAGIRDVEQRLADLQARSEQLRAQLQQVLSVRQLDRFPELIAAADALLADADTLARVVDGLTQYGDPPPDRAVSRTLAQVDRLLKESGQMLAAQTSGLVPVEIDMDDAMLTALVQRFDLINQRGSLADSWRQIKLAGDDLKSVLNLTAGQTVRTEDNRPFAFTFDESQTRLNLSFDAPLNRRSQRNTFRRSLINYHVALRNLMEAEDIIKLNVRNQLRDLQLGREQYQISVASAALAYERVVSTRLQLQLGVQDVAARDFLEAQQAYTLSVSAVAGNHIRYIVDRIQLFLDLEELEVDDFGFWPELYNDDYQPTPAYQLPPYALPAYGCLAPRLLYSHKVKRMLHVPTGCSTIFRSEPPPPDAPDPPPELIPPPEPGELIPPPALPASPVERD